MSLYVCRFSNGHIKVGRSNSPTKRIANHANRVKCVGIQLVEHLIVKCIEPAAPREKNLIRKCAENASARHYSEWFVGLNFEDVCGWASAFANENSNDGKVVPIKNESPLDRAIRRAGGLMEFIGKLNERGVVVNQRATIYQWGKTRVPTDYCPDIEAITGVRCEELRDDVHWGVLRKRPKASAKRSKART